MRRNSDTSVRDTLVDCLSQQLSEFELLKSMYPNSDEIILTDTKILDSINQFLENESLYTPNHLDFVLNLIIDKLKLEICVDLPTLYPQEEPDIYIRCNQLNRQQETSLNAGLTNFIKNNHEGDLCLYTAISWLQENIDSFRSTINEKPVVETNITNNPTEDKFVRLWIYSHHIYNKKKREEIVKRARELNLTGFCLPGKPGIVCIEGADSCCKEWWRDIKSMTWKKIMIRKTETFDEDEKSKEQRFSNFEEIHFQNPSSRHSKHADMSGFSKYMDEHNLTQSFNDIFGICNDT